MSINNSEHSSIVINEFDIININQSVTIETNDENESEKSFKSCNNKDEESDKSFSSCVLNIDNKEENMIKDDLKNDDNNVESDDDDIRAGVCRENASSEEEISSWDENHEDEWNYDSELIGYSKDGINIPKAVIADENKLSCEKDLKEIIKNHVKVKHKKKTNIDEIESNYNKESCLNSVVNERKEGTVSSETFPVNNCRQKDEKVVFDAKQLKNHEKSRLQNDLYQPEDRKSQLVDNRDNFNRFSNKKNIKEKTNNEIERNFNKESCLNNVVNERKEGTAGSETFSGNDLRQGDGKVIFDTKPFKNRERNQWKNDLYQPEDGKSQLVDNRDSYNRFSNKKQNNNRKKWNKTNKISNYYNGYYNDNYHQYYEYYYDYCMEDDRFFYYQWDNHDDYEAYNDNDNPWDSEEGDYYYYQKGSYNSRKWHESGINRNQYFDHLRNDTDESNNNRGNYFENQESRWNNITKNNKKDELQGKNKRDNNKIEAEENQYNNKRFQNNRFQNQHNENRFQNQHENRFQNQQKNRFQNQLGNEENNLDYRRNQSNYRRIDNLKNIEQNKEGGLGNKLIKKKELKDKVVEGKSELERDKRNKQNNCEQLKNESRNKGNFNQWNQRKNDSKSNKNNNNQKNESEVKEEISRGIVKQKNETNDIVQEKYLRNVNESKDEIENKKYIISNKGKMKKDFLMKELRIDFAYGGKRNEGNTRHVDEEAGRGGGEWHRGVTIGNCSDIGDLTMIKVTIDRDFMGNHEGENRGRRGVGKEDVAALGEGEIGGFKNTKRGSRSSRGTPPPRFAAAVANRSMVDRNLSTIPKRYSEVNATTPNLCERSEPLVFTTPSFLPSPCPFFFQPVYRMHSPSASRLNQFSPPFVPLNSSTTAVPTRQVYGRT